jgi:anaerobic selenocysteine-containing dehydrogenase
MNRDLDWFMENGFRSWKKRPEECYWRYQVTCRVPVYYEHHLHTYPNLKKKCEELDWNLDLRHWSALPSYYRPLMYERAPGEPEDWRDSEYNLITVTHRDSLHAHATSSQNPWIDEMSKTNPYSYNWMMHHDYAQKKGIEDGDWIVVENHAGDQVPGRVKLTWLIHYNCIGAVGLGTWSKYRPVGRDKGIRYNELLRGNSRNFCSLTGSFEDSARVRAYKVEGEKLRSVLEKEGYEKLKEELFA